MTQQQLDMIIPTISLVAAFILAFASSLRVTRLYSSAILQQRAYFNRFLISLALYYASGFLGGVILFQSSPLSSLCRVAAFMDIPLYAIGFLLLALTYLALMLMNRFFSKRHYPDVSEEVLEEGGAVRLFPRLVRFVRRHPRFGYFIAYSVLFAVIFALVFSVNLVQGKGLIWRVDGKSQYLPYMSYMADYLRELFENLSNGDYTIRMYDFSIGMGEDIRSVFRIHPTEFLSVLFDRDHLEALYNILMVLRYYAAGLTFACYCRHRGISRRNTLVASFTYIFSGYGINMAVKHPIFNSPVIFLPLLLLAIDRLIEKKGSLFFTFMVALSMATSYYFLYMTTAALGVYALVRFAGFYKSRRIREFFQMMGRIILFYLLGLAIAAAAFLPTVIRALTSERVGSVKTAYHNLLSYGDLCGIKVFLSTISGKYANYDVHLSFAVIFLPALAVLFTGKLRDHAGLKVILILEAAAAVLPAVGLAMSAFSTVSNRWVYVLAMTGAYTIAVTMDDFRHLSLLQSFAIVVITALYGGACYYMQDQTEHTLDLTSSFRLLLAASGLILFISLMRHITRTQLTAAMCILTAVSLGLHGCYLFGNETDPLSDDFLTTGKDSVKYFNKEEFLRLANISDDSFYRCDTPSMRDHYENTSAIFGYNGTSIYNSVINSNLVKYHVELGSAGISAVHRIYSLDGRTAMEALACVKYYQVEAGNDLCVPYGFKKSESLSDDNFWVYENQYPLSIGYTYDSWIDRSDYEELSTLEKQQVMLKSAVLDQEECGLSDPSSLFDTGEILTAAPEISEPDDALNQGDNYFKKINSEDKTGIVSEFTLKNEDDTAGFSLTYEKKKGYEAYLYLEDFETNIPRAKLLLSNDHFDKKLIVRNEDGTYSLDRDDYYISLGCGSKDEIETVKLSFANSASYSIKDIRICYVPLTTYKQDIAALSADSLENVSVSANQVSGTVSLAQSKIMVFSIPWSTGWTATVDGEKADLFQANTAYMGLALEPGDHSITLTYETPGLRIGCCASAAGILLFILIALIGGIRKLLKH